MRSSTVLDEDAKQMLKDCQDYLHGQSDYLSVDGDPRMEHNIDHSPTSGQHQYGRSVHSSPGDSYNRYTSSHHPPSLTHHPHRSSSPGSGSLMLDTGTPARVSGSSYADNSSIGGGHSRVGKTRSVSSLNTVHSSPGGGGGSSKEPSISSRKTSKTSLDNMDTSSSALMDPSAVSWRHNDRLSAAEQSGAEGLDQYCQVTVEAREKLAASKSAMGSRERRNSFRKAVDRQDAAAAAGGSRNYEQIWLRGAGVPPTSLSAMDTDEAVAMAAAVSTPSSGNSPRSTSAAADHPEVLPATLTSKNINTRTLSSSSANYPVYANAAARSSGSYDNVRLNVVSDSSQLLQRLEDQQQQHQYKNLTFTTSSSNVVEENQYKNIPYTVEELSREERRRSRADMAAAAAAAITPSDVGDSSELAGSYEPVNFHNIRINEAKPPDGYYNNNNNNNSTSSGPVVGQKPLMPAPLTSSSGGSPQADSSQRGGKGSALMSAGSPQDRGKSSSMLSSASLVAEACRDYERGGRIGLPQGDANKGGQSAEPQKPSVVYPGKQSLQKKNSGGGGVRLPPPYQAPPGPLYQPPGGTPGGQFQAGGPGQYQQGYQRIPTQVDVTPVRGNSGTPVRATPRSSSKSSHPSTSPHYLTRHPPPPYPANSAAGRPASSPQTAAAQVPDQQQQQQQASYSNQPLNSGGLSQQPQFPPVGGSGGPAVVHRRNLKETSRVRDDSYLPSRSSRDDLASSRQMKRNSSLVTMARAGVPDFSGLVVKTGGSPTSNQNQQTPFIVQGSRTTVQLGGGSPSSSSPSQHPGGAVHPPGVDIDRVAAAMLTSSSVHDRDSAPLSQVAAHQGRQLGRSLVGVFSGAAANLKSKLVGGIAAGSVGGGRTAAGGSSPSPPRRRDDTDSVGSFESRSITAPGNLSSQDLGYPLRIKSRPQGPRDTPPSFVKKQEYL